MELTGQIIARKYRLNQKLGAGSFGSVYSAVDVTSGLEVAAKVEQVSTRIQLSAFEARIMRQLRGGEGIPQIFWQGSELDYNILIMQQLGPTLEDLLQSCNHVFSLKTSIMLALQLLTRIEFIHSHSYLHRDIKPDNFLVDRESMIIVYAIDFGLAKKYRDATSHQHIQYRENKSMTGTARYVSIMTHMGIEQSRRDDIESIGYMLVYFLKGSLPWQGIEATNRHERYTKIMERKLHIKLDVLCMGLPPEFTILLQYSRALKFEEKPDYNYLKNIFTNLASRENITINDRYDWHIPKVSASDRIESLAIPGTKKRRSRHLSKANSGSQLMRLDNLSSKVCEADSNRTEEMPKAPRIRNRVEFNKLIDQQFDYRSCFLHRLLIGLASQL